MAVNFDVVTAFGGIDADNDPLLDRCFETHRAYLDARSHSKTVILGRKGSGKTAIFRQFVKIADGLTHSSGHVFSDYPWHYHAKQRQTGVPEEHCYVNSWEYLIYIALAKLLLREETTQSWSAATTHHIAILKSFISDTYGSTDPDLSTIFYPEMTVKVKAELGVNLKLVNAKLTGEAISMEYLPTVVSDINKRLQQIIVESANPDRHYFVCFDELDLGFSLETKDYKSHVTGLLIAARKINTAARQANKNMSVIVFLRDDIYNMLHFEDKNKITVGSVSLIEWDVEKGGPSLKSIAERRFSEIFNIDQQGSWSEIFDETKEMSSRQTKYSHIVDRTFLRPRDIIQFLNEILRVHRQANDGQASKFNNRNVIAARLRYSQYLLDELDDEIRKHHPDYKKYLEIFKTIGSLQFSLLDLEAALNRRSDLGLKETSPRQLLSNLFEFSVIGFYKPGGAGYGGADYVWRHKDRRIQFNDNASSYRVHPGLMEVLGLKKWTKSS